MKRLMLLAALAVPVGLTACSSAPQPAAPGAPAMPRTKEEVLRDLAPILEPYRAAVNNPALTFTEEQREQVIAGIREAQQRYGAKDYAQAAFRELGAEIAQLALRARDQERWRLVEALIDVHEMLQLESVMMDRLSDRAEKILAMPKVKVRGFFEDQQSKSLTVFMEVTDRFNTKRQMVRARVGETFNDLRLKEIIGNNSGVRLEYLKIPGLEFTVEGVSRLSRPPKEG